MLHFCTYFDINYLVKGLVLYRSLARHCSSFTLWILCLDEPVYQILQKLALPKVKLVALAEIEAANPELLQAKNNRSLIEYYFTCTPAINLYLLNTHLEIDMITYLDADLMFFADPEPLYKEMGDKTMLIIPHRFPPQNRDLEKYGLYNVQMLAFRRDEHSLACLKWWYERCIEWCFDRLEDDKYAEQKYLNVWTEKFEGVHVLEHKGGGLAPWNLANYRLTNDVTHIMVDDDPLIFYHYHGLRSLTGWVFQFGVVLYNVRVTPEILNFIYLPYIGELKIVETWLKSAGLLDHHVSRTRVSYHLRILLRTLYKSDLFFLFNPKLRSN